MQQGEQITLTFDLKTRDGSPYIVSNQLKNPYYILTITSAHLAQADRYVLNRWCEVPADNCFYCTKPITLSLTVPVSSVNSITQVLKTNEQRNDALSHGGYDSYAIYIVDDKYYRWETTSGTTGKLVSYNENVFSVTFTPEITENWTGRDFTYDIKLIDGNKVEGDYRPISIIDFSQIILAPTKLIVDAKLNIGG